MFRVLIDAIDYLKPLSRLERELWVEAKFFAEREGIYNLGLTIDKERYKKSKSLLDENSNKIFLLVEESTTKTIIDIIPLIKYIPADSKCLEKYLDMKQKCGETDSIYKIKIENLIEDIELNNPGAENIF